MDADVGVMGYGPIQKRIESGKLTFIMGERLQKDPWFRLKMLHPRIYKSVQKIRRMASRPNAHALTIGHYASRDLATVVKTYGSRIWNWAYFVEVNPNPPLPVADRPLKLLWAGRMLDWKRCDLLIRAVSRIQNAPWFGSCQLVGDGAEKVRLLRLAEKLKIAPSRIFFKPPVPFHEVRHLMREADVYVFPSNRREGWGAVVGEAMSEGSIIVANQEAGAARILVDDGRTGLLFRDGDVAHLVEQLTRLGTDYSLRNRLRQQAWEHMRNLWNAKVGAEHLIALCRGILDLAPMPDYREGPCSRC
jgi:glycosyltransferase involved in cell wall biosynthesis